MAPKLTVEMRTEIFMLHTTNSVQKTAEIFNGRYPERAAPLSASTVSKIWNKFQQTGSVHDRKKSGRPATSVSEDNSIDIMAQVQLNPHSTTRSLARDAGISKGSVSAIMKKIRFHPYKMVILHKLKPEDYPKRVEFCTKYLDMVNNSQRVPFKVLWTDESIFTLKGWINKQNYRYVEAKSVQPVQ